MEPKLIGENAFLSIDISLWVNLTFICLEILSARRIMTHLFGSLCRNSRTNSFLGVQIVAVILLLPGAGFAQLSTASINGVVRDSSGAVIPKASIVLRNADTATENTTVSNSAGAYVLLNIIPGRYTLEAKAPSFSVEQITEFTLSVNQIATFDFSLAVGGQTSVVTVQAAAPLLDVTSANLGAVIDTKQVNDLPLNGRNFTQLLLLTPGVSPLSTGQNQNMQSGGGYFVPTAIGSDVVFPPINGQSTRSNFFRVDGLNDYGSLLSTYDVPPIIDAIQEFKIVSHTDSAEFGSVLGGVVDVTTKSGTNALHGSLWAYDRDQIFDARSYFLPTDIAKTPYHQKQFGGSIGGPVLIPKLYNRKNRTFFFGAYQGFRLDQTSDTPLHVPTAAELAGDESDWPTQIYNPFTTRPDPTHPGQYIRDPFPGNQIPANLIQQPLVNYINALYPKAGPVIDSSGDNALDSTPIVQNQNEWSIRIDQKIGSQDSFFFRYSAINSTVTDSGGVPGLPSVSPQPARNWGVSYVHVFTPSLVLQGQYSRTSMEFNSTVLFTQPTASVYNQLGFAPAFTGNLVTAGSRNLLPDIVITGYSNGGESVGDSTLPPSNEFSGTLSKTFRDHSLKFGGGYISLGLLSSSGFTYEPFVAQNTADTNPLDSVNSGSPMASFLLGIPGGGERANSASGTRPGGVLSAFAQDSWKATNNLTLNYGLRYDITLVPPLGIESKTATFGGPQQGDMDFSNGTYILQQVPPACNVAGKAPCIPGDGTLPAHVVVDPRGKIAYDDVTNFGPRIGFADRVGKKTVVKGAFGIVYDNYAAAVQVANNLGGSWPDLGVRSVTNLNQPSSTSPSPTLNYQNPFGSGNSGLIPAPTPFDQVDFFYDPHRKNPRSMQWNFGGERQLNASTALTLNYVGMSSQHLDVGGFYNTALTPGPGDPQSRSPYPYIVPTLYDRSAGSASYNGLQFLLAKRYSDGWSYSVAYTWSKAINIGTDGWFDSEGGVPQDPYAPGAYGGRGVAGFDVTNMLSVDTLNEVPIGRGRRFSTGNSVLDYALGNWQINNIFIAHSGQPFNPKISSDIANTGNGDVYETANLIGNPSGPKTASEWFNTAAYITPPGYTYGTTSRNSLRSAGSWDLDSSLFRQFPIGEGRQFEFRAEAFNLFNHPVLGIPISDLNTGPLFGTINSTASTARELQLALRFVF
jgi:hypothetical protein